MNEMRFYVESARYAAIKRLVFIIGVIPMIILFFTGLLVIMGEHGKFVRTCVKLCVPAGILTAGCIAGAMYVYYKYRETITIAHLPQGAIQINIRNAQGVDYGATGRWSYHALYTKHYHKYGTYRKYLFLILFCNDKMFCVMRHEVAPAFDAPQGFREIASEPQVDVPVYFTRKTVEVFGIMRMHMQVYAQQRTHAVNTSIPYGSGKPPFGDV